MDYDRGAFAVSSSPQSGHDAVVETTTCHFCRRADLWVYLSCGVCQLTTHAKCYYRLGSDEATYYDTHSSDWRCQDCGGPQRHADCALPNDEKMIQRHVGPRLSNSRYLMSGNGDVAAGAHQNLRSDSFLSDDGQVTGLWPTSGGLLYSERGGGAAGSAATPHRFALRRDQETVDCDMPDRLHADLLTPPRHDMLNFGSPSDVGIIGPDPRHVPEMDDMNIDIFDSSMPSSSAALTLGHAPAVRRRGPKIRKHSGDQRRSGARAPEKTSDKNSGARAPAGQ